MLLSKIPMVCKKAQQGPRTKLGPGFCFGVRESAHCVFTRDMVPKWASRLNKISVDVDLRMQCF